MISDVIESNLPVLKRKLGRPARVSLEMVKRVGKLVGQGLTVEQACILEEPPITEGVFSQAVRRNKDFDWAYKREISVFIATATERILKGAGNGWQGAAWLLERRHKPQFARQELVQVNNSLVVNGLELPVANALRLSGRKSSRVVDVEEVKPKQLTEKSEDVKA